jgi:hypothetical protein
MLCRGKITLAKIYIKVWVSVFLYNQSNINMTRVFCASKSYGLFLRANGREKFSMTHVKNGISNTVVRFDNKGSALMMKDMLNISLARFGVWDCAVEKRGEKLVLTGEMKDFENDAADFEYVGVESYDDSNDNDCVKFAEI